MTAKRLMLAAALVLGAVPAAAVPPGTSPGTAYSSIDTKGRTNILAVDGSTQVRTGLVLGPDLPIEIPSFVAGPSGAGATFACLSDSSVNVDCNVVGQGASNILFANGTGRFWQFLDPGVASYGYMSFTPATAGNLYQEQFTVVPTNAASQVGVLINTYNGGFGAGPGDKTQNLCDVLGSYGQCFGKGSFASGYAPYDWSATGVRIHQSSGTPTTATVGSNQVWEQTLWVSFTGSAGAAVTARLTVDGSSGVSMPQSMPVQANGHGTFQIQLECTVTGVTGTGDSATWTVAGSFTRYNGAALHFPYVTGTGAPLGTTGSLSGMTLSVTPDTTNNNFNISVTFPSGTVPTIGCEAVGRWMQRIS